MNHDSRNGERNAAFGHAIWAGAALWWMFTAVVDMMQTEFFMVPGPLGLPFRHHYYATATNVLAAFLGVVWHVVAAGQHLQRSAEPTQD
jgi:hypothetical protein